MLYELLDPVAGDDWEKIKENLEARMKWIWEVDTEGELEKALRMLEE